MSSILFCGVRTTSRTWPIVEALSSSTGRPMRSPTRTGCGKRRRMRSLHRPIGSLASAPMPVGGTIACASSKSRPAAAAGAALAATVKTAAQRSPAERRSEAPSATHSAILPIKKSARICEPAAACATQHVATVVSGKYVCPDKRPWSDICETFAEYLDAMPAVKSLRIRRAPSPAAAAHHALDQCGRHFHHDRQRLENLQRRCDLRLAAFSRLPS